ncbi:tetraacyldisaccharide 4'-kinase [Anatilimnocola floriformis]|uniref:tetraacyldisaccharide 4'-kinase n=1 Tax=Anatilimnocola floriformis TaxID=2948575 RepID=UPI0020C3C925|nr:tetraacyldisaccharide 4'-kinase [Anatilimnocola floriformis]
MALVSAETFRDIVSGRRRGFLPAALRSLLATAEPIYGAVVARKNRRYDNGGLPITRVDAPVISVGNLTVGGTGKTPLVIWLAKWFCQRGVKVTLISRGYGQKQGPNDEAREIAANLPDVPQLQNPDRVAAARQAIREHQTQVLLLDDAFQHRRIARDLDIVLIDALEPFGYGRLLPRGLLREPIANLARAHVVALSRADAVSAERREELRAVVAKYAPQAIWLELAHQPVALLDHAGHSEPLAKWQGQRLAAFAGIGNPAGFEHTLRQCGLQIAAFRALADHQAYSPAIIASLEIWLRAENAAAAVCTHKDLVKIPQATLGNVPLLALQIALAVTRGEDELNSLLTKLIHRAANG